MKQNEIRDKFEKRITALPGFAGHPDYYLLVMETRPA